MAAHQSELAAIACWSSSRPAIAPPLRAPSASRRICSTLPASGPSRWLLPLRSLRTTTSPSHSRQTIASGETQRQCGADSEDMQDCAAGQRWGTDRKRPTYAMVVSRNSAISSAFQCAPEDGEKDPAVPYPEAPYSLQMSFTAGPDRVGVNPAAALSNAAATYIAVLSVVGLCGVAAAFSTSSNVGSPL